MVLYPNPAASVLYIQLAKGSTAQTYSIMDFTGKVVLTGAISGTTVVNTEALAAGTYLVAVTGSGQKTVRMFIKQ